MSMIFENGEEVSKSSLNKSLSKQMFSFPKAERFKKQHTKRYISCTNNFD